IVCTGDSRLPSAITCCSAPTLTGEPTARPEASFCVTSMRPRSTVIVERVPAGSESTSATTMVPRMAAVAFGVTISTESPGRIRSFITLTAARPDVTLTVDTGHFRDRHDRTLAHREQRLAAEEDA